MEKQKGFRVVTVTQKEKEGGEGRGTDEGRRKRPLSSTSVASGINARQQVRAGGV